MSDNQTRVNATFVCARFSIQGIRLWLQEFGSDKELRKLQLYNFKGLKITQIWKH